jgi:hypothetical protein
VYLLGVVRELLTDEVLFSLVLLGFLPSSRDSGGIIRKSFFLALFVVSFGEDSPVSEFSLSGRGSSSLGSRSVCSTDTMFLSSVLALSPGLGHSTAVLDNRAFELDRRVRVTIAEGSGGFVLALFAILSGSTALIVLSGRHIVVGVVDEIALVGQDI